MFEYRNVLYQHGVRRIFNPSLQNGGRVTSKSNQITSTIIIYVSSKACSITGLAMQAEPDNMVLLPKELVA